MRLSLKRACPLALVVVGAAFAGCASPQRLSASIYEHEQRAGALDAAGDRGAARAEWAAAQRQREIAARHQAVVRLGQSQ